MGKTILPQYKNENKATKRIEAKTAGKEFLKNERIKSREKRKITRAMTYWN